jgi:GxxExxY protein
MSVTGVLDISHDQPNIRGVGLSTDEGTDKRSGPKPHSDLTYKIIAAAMRVHNQLGPGLKEAFYQRALSAQLAEAGVEFVAEQPIEISIEGNYIGQLYVDHLVGDAVIVEEKAVSHLLTNDEVAQVITYLVASGMPVGLLLNFGRRSLEYKRVFPPRNAEAWRNRIRRYVWLPPQPQSVHPLKESVDSEAGR